MKTFYLSSHFDFPGLAPIRKCILIKKIWFSNGIPGIVVYVDDDEFNKNNNSSIVFFTGWGIFSNIHRIKKFPYYIDLWIPTIPYKNEIELIVRYNKITRIGSGELYRTKAQAEDSFK